MAGDRPVMRVFDADADVEGVPRRTYAEVIRSRVVKAIAAYREDRSPRLLMLHTAYALGATLGFVLLLVGLRWAFRKLDLIVERRLQLRIKTLEAHTHAVIQAGQVWNAIRALLKGLQFFLAAAAAFLYLHFVLGLYPWTRPLSRRLLEILLNPLRVMAEGLFDALPGLAFIAILILLVRFALKLIRFFFTGIDQGTINLASFDRDWALPTFKIIRLLIVIFAIMVAYPYIPGSESTAFKGLSIFLGFLVSLGSTSLISSLIAGYTMIYRRAYKVGDFIQVNDFTGEVTETPLIVTHLRTIKNEEVVVPNSVMVNTDILNYSTHARSRGGDSAYHRRHRLRDPLAAGRSDPPARRGPDAGLAQGTVPLCPDKNARGLLRHLRDQRLLRQPSENGPPLFRAASQHPRPVQRVRGSDHDAGV
ncbi:MAG: mechanosensitive ion channel [Candidatus Manganitrophus sp.]|nr:mechanosensitive ion channel [Candidatus Manganitrophus sp.]